MMPRSQMEEVLCSEYGCNEEEAQAVTRLAAQENMNGRSVLGLYIGAKRSGFGHVDGMRLALASTVLEELSELSRQGPDDERNCLSAFDLRMHVEACVELGDTRSIEELWHDFVAKRGHEPRDLPQLTAA